jgi:hypothetical protein
MASWMSWLPPGFASTLLATPTRPLLTGQAIRGWRFRGNRRILLLQGELTFEIGNAFRLLLELFAKAFVLLAQPFDLVRRVGTRVARGGSSRRARFFRPRTIGESVRNRYEKYKYKIVPSVRA